MNRDRLPVIRLRTWTLVSAVLVALMWEFTIALFIVDQFLDPDWLTPARKWAAFAASIVFTLHYYFWGRPRFREFRLSDGYHTSLTGWQVTIVVALIVATSAVMTWIFIPHP